MVYIAASGGDVSGAVKLDCEDLISGIVYVGYVLDAETWMVGLYVSSLSIFENGQ